MPKTSQNRSKSRLGRLLGASRTGVGNELEKGNLGIIELGGFGTPKIDSRSTPEGFKKPSKFHSFFDIVSARFSWPLGSQHGTQNPSESIKNRRRYRSLSWSPLNIRFPSNFCAKIGAAEERGKHFRSGNNASLTISACWRSSQNSTRVSCQKLPFCFPKSFKNRAQDASERVSKSQ